MEFNLMRTFIIVLLMVGFTLTTTAQKQTKVTAKQAEPAKIELKTFEDSVAYAIGVNIGNNLLKDELFFNLDIVKAGMNDALNTKKPLLTAEQLQEVFQKFGQMMQEKQQKEQEVQGKANIEKGKTFLDQNAKKAGVTVTASGLQYEVIQEGTGAKPTAEDKVKVHYTGTLIDGTKFDSSVDRGEPITFPLGNVIKGWIEGLQLMSVGSKYKLYIPSELGYGAQGSGGGQIGPNEVLIFEVELLGIEK